MVCMGEIAVVLIENNSEAVIRKVNYGPNWIELQPTNLNYPTQRFEGENIDKIKIIGLVKEVSKPI
jgi:SOS-response transcriptional repressor LexA